MSHKGLLAIVTGADSGIGLCFSRELAREGCRLLMVSNCSEGLERESKAIADEFGVSVDTLCVDLTAADATDTVSRRLDERGEVPDVLINNAGIFSFKPLTDTPVRTIDLFIDLHIRAVTMLTAEIGRRMAARGRGWILNMSSMSCWTPMPGLAMYSATKAYIRVMTRSVAYELADSGVKVMCATPGGIATDLFGLPPALKRLALNLRAIQTPEKFARKALKRMWRGKRTYVNGLMNRIAIPAVWLTPKPIKMLVKHKMLDKGITR